jgi:hypothetical protein
LPARWRGNCSARLLVLRWLDVCALHRPHLKGPGNWRNGPGHGGRQRGPCARAASWAAATSPSASARWPSRCPGRCTSGTGRWQQFPCSLALPTSPQQPLFAGVQNSVEQQPSRRARPCSALPMGDGTSGAPVVRGASSCWRRRWCGIRGRRPGWRRYLSVSRERLGRFPVCGPPIAPEASGPQPGRQVRPVIGEVAG